MRRAWRRRAVPVGEALKSLAREIGMEARLHEIEILRAWPGAVGPATAAHAQPARLHGGTLLVQVTDSAWLHRLSMARRDVARNLNDRLGAPVVKGVRLRIGPVDGTAQAARGARGGSRSVPDAGETRRVGPPQVPAAGLDDPLMGRVLASVRDLPFSEVVQRILRRQAALAPRR